MLENFFQTGSSIPVNQMTGSYDPWLVLLSYIVAVLASYIALDLTIRLRDVNNTRLSQFFWLIGGSVAMGAGIWSMHFIGMLAFSMDMPMSYSIPWTIASLIVAVFASCFALSMLMIEKIHAGRLIIGGFILGIAISTMHYTGMHGMIGVSIRYIPSIFILSILIGIIASEAALWLALKSAHVTIAYRLKLKIVSASIMGAAICGMHYTGMAAAVFTHTPIMMNIDNALDPHFLSIMIAVVTISILALALMFSAYQESLNQQLIMTARLVGMSEVASNVIHNVGNVLNSLKTSSSTIKEKLETSKISELARLRDLLIENESRLSEFLVSDARGSIIPTYIRELTVYWEDEKKKMLSELKSLQDNINHIQAIIASQQSIHSSLELKHEIDIKSVIDEALHLSGLDISNIHVIRPDKDIQKEPILIDKVKLLQVLINILSNAKDACLSIRIDKPTITISVNQSNNSIKITVIDNGIGIKKQDLSNIFRHGFTTKPTGHGFGLHSSINLIKEMGGNIKVESDGENQGSKFTITLPLNE